MRVKILNFPKITPMPIIGTSSEVNFDSLNDLTTQTTAGPTSVLDNARLSLQKNKKGNEILVASQGTLSDGLYSIWAYFHPQQAAKARLDTLTAIKDKIASFYGSDSEQKIFNKLAESSTNPRQSSTIRSYYFTANDLKNFANAAKATELVINCPDKSLADALFDNQFRIPTEQDQKIASGNDDATGLARFLSSQFDIGDAVYKRVADTAFNEELKSLSQPPKIEYDNLTKENIADYKELGTITAKFKKSQLPSLTKELKLEKAEKAFDTAVKNFLDQNPKTTVDLLQAFLNKYSKQLLDQNPVPEAPAEDSTQETGSPEEQPKENNPLAGINARKIVTTKLTLDFKNLSEQISTIRRERNYDQFFKLLSNLSNDKVSFKNADRKELTKNGKDYFTQSLLDVFTVTKENEDAVTFFTKLGKFLASVPEKVSEITETHHQEAAQLLGMAQEVIRKNQLNQEAVAAYSKAIKDYVEFQIKNEQPQPTGTIKQGDTVGGIQAPRVQPLLSPDAIDLLQEAISFLTPDSSDP